MRTLWIPKGEPDAVRAAYRAALARLGWRPGAWRRCEPGRALEGPTHLCLPTGAGVFLLPPDDLEAGEGLARALSLQVGTPLLALSPGAILVLSGGAVVLRSRLWKSDPAALAAALGTETEPVRALLQAAVSPASRAEGAGHPAEGAAWDLVALRVA